MYIFNDFFLVLCKYLNTTTNYFQLQYDVDDKKVKEVFSLAGDIENIDIRLDSDGKSRGFCTIRFKMELHAVQAIC